MIPTCTDERKFSGFSKSCRIIFALLFHLEARCWILLFFTDTRAISESAKNQFNKVSIAIIINSIWLLLSKSCKNPYDIKKPSKINKKNGVECTLTSLLCENRCDILAFTSHFYTMCPTFLLDFFVRESPSYTTF